MYRAQGRRSGPSAPPIEGRSFIEHDDRAGGGFHTKKRKGRGSFRGRMYSEQGYRSRYRGGGPPRSRLEDRDGDISMNDTLENPRNRYNPYGHRPPRHGEDLPTYDQSGPSNIHVTVRRDMPSQDQRGVGAKEFNKNWYLITIPQGRKYEKKWLLSSIQSACGVPFIPVEFNYENLRAEFYVEGKNVADALQQISRKITDKNDCKVVILARQTGPPHAMQKGHKDLKDEDIVQLKLSMSKRYDGALQALDLKNLRADTELLTQGVVVVLNKRNYMEAVLRIIEENIPELLALNLSDNKIFRLEDMIELPQKAPLLKHLNLSGNDLRTERELDHLKGMKLEELWLDGNPLCDSFRDQSTYISAIRERFPKLLRLDGHDLPPPIAFDLETPTTLPPLRGSYFGSDEIKVLVLRFVHQYFTVYDSGDRQALLEAYHDGACCSINIPFFTQNQSRNNLSDYFKDSRNVKKQKDLIMRYKLLKHTRLNVVAFLNELPKTLHDVNSFVIDITAQTNTLLCFAVHGIFKEVEGKFRETMRAFNRVFIAVPAPNSGLCVVNDQLHVRQATQEESSKAFVTPAPTPSSSPVTALPSTQQEMLQAFSLQSGMNIEWSQKCLIDNDWDFARAAQIFTQLKMEGKIPDVAFLK